ncbi:MAG: hypothetical protein EA402_04470 [Planctomycetota bacterium]|nr:MAG: hypothetical protein EA402_04470 [Planctomycetota bacterium]
MNQHTSPASGKWVVAFDQPLSPDMGDARSLLGGKGASLAGMTAAGFAVPPGFTITTEACRQVMQHGQWPEGLAAEVDEHVARLEAQCGRRFGDLHDPLLVSVRSGAAQSMPGMMDTLLNVGLHPQLVTENPQQWPHFWEVYAGFLRAFLRSAADLELPEGDHADPRTSCERMLALWQEQQQQPFPETPRAILQHSIDAVFRSWHSDRARTYRRRHGLDDSAGTAVNIQVMFPSQVSGVVFTRDPNDPHSAHLVIEAARGLGEAVVSGDVTPDRYCIDRSDHQQGTYYPGESGREVRALDSAKELEQGELVLPPEQIRALAQLCMRVEEWYGAAMDIEWGLRHGELALLQCRPIRGMDVLLDREAARQEAIAHLRAQLPQGGKRSRKVWVTHNLGETLAYPTPMSWDIVRDFMRGDGGFGLLYQDLGYLPSEQVRKEGFLELICGRIYADPDRLAQLFWGGMPLTYDCEAIVADPAQLEGPPKVLDPDRADAHFLAQLPRTLMGMWRTARHMRQEAATAEKTFEQEILPPWLEYCRTETATDLSQLNPAELLATLHERIQHCLHRFATASLKPGFHGGLALAQLQGIFARFCESEEATILARRLTSGMAGDITWEQDELLAQVAHGEACLEDFLARFGHRASGEMELATPRWREDPEALDGMLTAAKRISLDDLRARHQAAAQQRQAAEDGLDETLYRWGARSHGPRIRHLISRAQTLLPYREKGKYYLMMGYDLIRRCLLELARRYDMGPDIFYLTPAELTDYPQRRDELRECIEARRIRSQAHQRLDLAPVIDSEQLEQLGIPDESDSGEERDGIAISAGISTGTVRIVHDPRDAHDLGEGYILVCPSTDPGWTPLFIGAHGLVVERGGTLSHGAIVARDFGIPAVTLPRATSWLADGERIRVDGNRGRVVRIQGGDDGDL